MMPRKSVLEEKSTMFKCLCFGRDAVIDVSTGKESVLGLTLVSSSFGTRSQMKWTKTGARQI